MAGYSGRPLAQKLGLKPRHRVALLGAPRGFRNELGALPSGVRLGTTLKPATDIVLLFAEDHRGLSAGFPAAMRNMTIDGMIWVAWPKQASGVATDLSGDRVRAFGLQNGLVDVKVCAVNDVWSGLKFVRRVKDREAIRRETGALWDRPRGRRASFRRDADRR